jgi:nucleoside phosphorylase
MAKEYFDLLVIVPLEEELQALMEVFPGVEDRSTPSEFRYAVDSGAQSITMLVVQQEGMGKAHAVQAVSSALQDFSTGIVTCFGIAGSLSDDMRLGDVCYSGSIIDVYDNIRASDDSKGQLDFGFSPNYYKTPREITGAISFIRTLPELKGLYDEWQRGQEAISRQIITTPILGRGNKPEILGRPTTRNGTIVCGAVSRSESYNDKLRAIDRKLLAIETESGGIFERAHMLGLPALTIRGISDYADRGKGALEDETAGNVRRVAALNAASFLRLQMNNSRFVGALRRRREAVEDSKSTQITVASTAGGDLLTLIQEVGQQIDEKLRELSPEFRLQPKGYCLPVPRVREITFPGGIDQPAEAEPADVRDVLQRRRGLLVTMPRNYPDQSLAWVLGEDLLTVEIAGKQVVPIVVDGRTLSPPRSGLANALRQFTANWIGDLSGTQIVFIIENIPLSSKTRLNFLIEETKLFPEAKFIFLTRNDLNISTEYEFSAEASAGLFRLSDISFLEIAHFIQKNFSMTGSESEVIALRLRDTFNQFNLSAHPTYFAGIPREILSALLQANRRAELIQLAVDGFLTFVVADDLADVTLSRTTRSRFLRKLAVVLKVDKVTLDQKGLVGFTQIFSSKYDFDINPIQFIHSFIDKGVLYFEGDSIRFSLPFIESYLLALELSQDEPAALRYFDFGSRDFDLYTFDLYCEIGPSSEMVRALIDNVNARYAELTSGGKNTHVFVDNSVQLPLLGRADRLKVVQGQLRAAAKAVEEARDDSARKQKVLDIADRIREQAAKQSKQASAGNADTKNAPQDRLVSAVQSWGIAAVLLGSGAEHLHAATKRELAGFLVRVAARIADEWTRRHAAVDFERLKRDLTKDENLAAFADSNGSPSDMQELKKLVNNIADVLEFYFVSEPFRRLIHHLCERARHRVLGISVQNADIEGQIERIIHGAWLTDIDSRRGRTALRQAIRQLSAAPFLRVILATHFITRVYWSHSRKEDRLVLLDAAEESIKPLAVTFNKPRLQRYIDRT